MAERGQNISIYTDDGKRHDFNGLFTGLEEGSILVRLTVGEPYDLPPGCTWSTISEMDEGS